jgi:hypothetical protein
VSVGAYSLQDVSSGSFNTALGQSDLTCTTTGSYNSACGGLALVYNTTGNFNSATGEGALFFNTTGNNNTAEGEGTLLNNTTGSNNTGDGFSTLTSITTGSNNIALGALAGSAISNGGSNNIDIGNNGKSGESNNIRIGTQGTQKNVHIAGIFGTTVASGVEVMSDNLGHLGTVTSSARFKENIRPMDKASEALLSLQPVSFHYKKELDPDKIPQFGLVAEEVAKVDPDLVVRDTDGKPYTVRYEAVNAMLLNEFLKEHRKVEDLEKTVSELKSALEAQAAQIEKVSARVQANAKTARLVSNTP